MRPAADVVDLECPDSVFPYDRRIIEHYNAILEFPGGLERAVISSDGEVKRMGRGPAYPDLRNVPLPHPLVLQLKSDDCHEGGSEIPGSDR